MMKRATTIAFLLAVSQLFCFAGYGTAFMGLEPSSINIAMGETAGVANIWHNNPLTFYANPAIASLHEGISYGYKRDNILEKYSFDSKYSSGLISIGYNGISLTLPAYNGSDRFGINYDLFPEIVISSWTDYYNALIWGAAVNPFELYRSFSGSEEVLRDFDLALGFNNVDLTWKLSGSANLKKSKAKSLNIGILTRYNKEISDNVIFEGTLGYSRFNLNNSTIKSNIFTPQTHQLYAHDNYGIASSFSFPAVNYDLGFLNQDYFHFTNLMTYRALASYKTDPNSSSTITGFGIEGGFLDALFLRAGRHIDKDGQREGNTYGFGINLNYKSIIALSYNYSVSRAYEIVNSEKAYDFGLSIDAFRLAGL